MLTEDTGEEREELSSDADKRLTNWDNPPTLVDLKADLEETRSSHDTHVQNVDRWLNNLRIKGSAKPKTKKGRSSVQPKVIRKQAEWRYAALTEPFLATSDVFNADPETAEDKEAAIQNGLVLNHQFNNRLDKEAFLDDYIHTAVDEGTVIVRVGWEYEERKYTEEVSEFEYHVSFDPKTIALHEDLHSMMENEPWLLKEQPEELQLAHQYTMDEGEPYKPVATGKMRTLDKVEVLKNQPSVEVCDYRNVHVDPTCRGDLNKANFIIFSFDTSKSALEKDGKYSNIDDINIEGNSPLNNPDHATQTDEAANFKFKDDARKKFVAYEYWGFWDYNDTGMTEPFVATWVGDTLIRMEENPYPDKKLPFVKAQYLPIRRSVYGEPDGELLEDNQKIIGAVTRGMIDTMGRSANGQVGSRKDALDITNKRKFDAGQDYEFNPGMNAMDVFHMNTYPEIPQSAEVMLAMQNADADSLTGVKAFSGGITGAALGDNVGGIKTAMDATAKRELNILRRLAKGIKEIGQKIISMNGEFLSDEEVVRITNEEFVTVRRDNLKGNFDLKLDISTAEADSAKAEELAFMLQTMGPNEDPGMRKMILSDIARLRKMPALAKKIADYEPQPDPLQQKKMELEIALLEAEVATERSKAIENQSSAILDEAKATNLGADTDKQNLDYVEQESGVTQARDLEKSGEQAKANMDLEVVKHGLAEESKKTDPPKGTA